MKMQNRRDSAEDSAALDEGGSNDHVHALRNALMVMSGVLAAIDHTWSPAALEELVDEARRALNDAARACDRLAT